MVADNTPHRKPFSPETMLPDLLMQYPSTRRVFDQYGLSGCGGRQGPVESIQFFARAHGVDEAQLLRELDAAAQEPSSDARVAPSCAVADTIYRRFFLAGILLVLTAGASWGALLLWQIGMRGNFTGVSIHDVNAHGHAQIFGWVGLFIMGFGYQAFPRIWHTKLFAPRLATASFLAMMVGLVVCTASMTQANTWSHAAVVALAGGSLEFLAIVAFAIQIFVTFRRSDARFEPYVGFIIAALVWFIAMGAMSAWHTWTTMTAVSREQLLTYLKTYQAPLRDLQIHGVAMFMILGVCLRMLPGLFDLPRIADQRAWRALAFLTAGMLGQIGLFIAYARTGSHVLAAMLMAPWLLLATGIIMVAWPWKFWRPLPISDRSGKFVRAAYGWLAISMTMLLLLPMYQWISGIPFSHAYYGAVRHAITVGFISLMIMGISAKVVPTLNGIDPQRLTALWGPFILVNLGCFLRVSTQTLTDWNPKFFSVVGVSGTLEVIGLAWWGFGLIRIMHRGRIEERQPETFYTINAAPSRIMEAHKVADVLDWFPMTQSVFDAFGFTALRQPLLRRTLGRRTSLRQAASLRGVSLEELLQELNSAAGLVETSKESIMIIRTDIPVRDVAHQHPDLVPTMRKLALDLCCEGEHTLQEIAIQKNIALAELVSSLVPEHICAGVCTTCDHEHPVAI